MSPRTIDLSGQVALITGAGRGIGRATAEALHSAGARLVLNYFEEGEGKNRAEAEALAETLGPGARAVAADVRDEAQVAALLDTIRASERQLDLLVNNAAILRDRTVKKMSALDWQAVIDTNLTSVFQVSRLAAEEIEDGGAIVNLSSIAAFVGAFGQANYVAAKAGVVGLTKVLSRELAKRRIRVNAVAPGVVDTDMVKTIPPEVLEGMRAQIPLARLAKPREIADVILFLASPLASYVTGQTLHVNGGWWSP